MTYKFFVNTKGIKKLSLETIDLILYLVKKYPGLKEIDITSIDGITIIKFLDKIINTASFKVNTKGTILVELKDDIYYIHFSEVAGD